MAMPNNVTVSAKYPVPESMKAWVLGDPGELTFSEKPVPAPNKAEVLVRIDAVAICATDLEIIYHGPPAEIQGGAPFNKNFTTTIRAGRTFSFLFLAMCRAAVLGPQKSSQIPLYKLVCKHSDGLV